MNLAVYIFSVLIGLVLGLMFSRIQYHRGRRDAFEEMDRDIQNVINKYAKNTRSIIENVKGE